jgi:integrase/recombinase XerD
VLLLGFNGLRISEALGANVTDLDTERGHRVLRIRRKGGKTATVPLAPRTAEGVDAYVGGTHRWTSVHHLHGSVLAPVRAGEGAPAAGEEGGSPEGREFAPHDLRHAFVTLSLDAGTSLRDVPDAAGHADPRTTRGYDRARQDLERHPTCALVKQVT